MEWKLINGQLQQVETDEEKAAREERQNTATYNNAENTAHRAQQAAQEQADKIKKQSQDYANTLTNQAQQFRSDLPSYLERQTNAATDSSKQALASDIANVKSNSNARGLLYSGVNEGNQAMARGAESAKLAKNIQNINDTANQQADIKDQLATQAQGVSNQQDLQALQMRAQNSETAYEQALKQQQSQQGFFGQLFGGIAGAVGSLLGAK
jgi:hypothetical protein